MNSDLAISHLKSLMLYATSGDYPLVQQIFVMNALLLAYAMIYRIRRKDIKYKARKNPIPFLVFVVNGLTLAGVITPIFKTVAQWTA